MNDRVRVLSSTIITLEKRVIKQRELNRKQRESSETIRKSSGRENTDWTKAAAPGIKRREMIRYI